MYGLPPAFNGTFLIGLILEQVCFSQNQVALHFSQSTSIVIESSFSYVIGSAESPSIIDIPVLQSNLMALIGRTISGAHGGKNGTLTIEFENGHVFKCYDTSKMYESYRIVVKGIETII